MKPCKESVPITRIAIYNRYYEGTPVSIASDAFLKSWLFHDISNDNNREIVGYYSDMGSPSSEIGNWIEFQSLISDCKKGRIDQIIAGSIAGFCQNAKDLKKTLDELGNMEPPVHVLFQLEHIDTRNETAMTKAFQLMEAIEQVLDCDSGDNDRPIRQDEIDER